MKHRVWPITVKTRIEERRTHISLPVQEQTGCCLKYKGQQWQFYSWHLMLFEMTHETSENKLTAYGCGAQHAFEQ